ncbi:AlpA family transcriptional regulator [Luteimonas aestuarii]|uniref:AlpA family transcriptional regulator n=1 Tax=Luteimonas aestuarii TaxID=453837 RepID=A0A4V3ALK9_9GAMM|nr:AlpA family transcriptional regulator [Luteimonas aestuarii]TDK23431.1 AlpA family transcriptional regulator [Luteimonas aestuarii]
METRTTLPSKGDRVLRIAEVVERTGLKRPTLYKRARAGTFPRPIKLGPNSTGWLESEIDAFLAAAVAQRDQAGAA